MAPSSPVPAFPSSDLSDREAVLRRQNRGPQFKFLVPLIYAPILPLIRIALRRNPVVRDRLFYGVLAGAFAHGAYLVKLNGGLEGKLELTYMTLKASESYGWRFRIKVFLELILCKLKIVHSQQ